MNIFSAIPAAIDVFRKGSAVADDVKAQNWSDLGVAVGVLIFAGAQLAKGLGYALPIDHDTAMQIGVGIGAVAGLLGPRAISSKLGLPGLAPVAGAGRGSPASEQGPLAAQVGEPAADAGKADTVRPSSDPSNPSSGYLPG